MTAREVYRFGAFILDVGERRLAAGSEVIRLPPKAFDVLVTLVRRPSHLLTKHELLAQVWGETFVDEGILTVHVSALRKVLGDGARLASFIETVPRCGYRFVAAVTRESQQESLRAAGSDDAEGEPLSIAVLPFVNLTEDRNTDYFSDGISEEILNALARDPALRVVARSSSFAFKDRPPDRAAITERLAVDVALEGSVRRAGPRVRVTTRLVDAVDGSAWWSRTFDRQLTDIFAIQDEIASAVASMIRESRPSRQSVAPMRAVHQRGTARRPNLDAYEEYLKGQSLNQLRIQGMQQARGHFERALSLDPEFAPAYAGLAQSYCWFGVYGAMPSNEAFVGTRRFAERALELDPMLADAHHLLGYVALWFEWDAAACHRHIARALAVSAHHADTLMLRAHLAIAQCRVDEALTAAHAALAVDPLGLATRANFVIIAFFAREFALAIQQANDLIAEYPTFSEGYRLKALSLSMQGDHGAALEVYEQAVQLSGGHPYATLGVAAMLALQGRRAEARERLATLRDRAEHEWIPPMGFAFVHQYLGDYESALADLERAYVSRDFLMPMMHIWKGFELVPRGRTHALCEEPRFRDLVRRIGIAPSPP